MGNYLGDILPAMNVRFIAIGDNVDSASGNLELNADILNHLVNRIVVGERMKDGDTVTQKIKIEYKFIGIL